MHRAQLHETIAGLKVRLEGQAKLDDDSAIGGALMRSRWQGQGGLTTCSPLSGDPVCAIAEAARRALARPCWGASEQEAHEERATAARVRSVLARTEVVGGAQPPPCPEAMRGTAKLVIGDGWVPKSTPAPLPKEVQARFKRPAFPHRISKPRPGR